MSKLPDGTRSLYLHGNCSSWILWGFHHEVQGTQSWPSAQLCLGMATWTGRAHTQHAAPHSAVPALSRSYTPQYDIIARGYARRRRKEAEHEASLAAAAAAAAAAALASDDVLRMQMELDAMLAQQKAKGDVTPQPGGALVITLLPLVTAGWGLWS